MDILKPKKSGKIRFNFSNSPTDAENYLESMENQLSSSGIFDRTYNIGDSQRDPGQKFRGFSMSSHLHVHVDDINWTKTGHCNECLSNSEEVKIFAKRFPLGHWSFFGPGEEGNWYGTHNCKPEGQWMLRQMSW